MNELLPCPFCESGETRIDENTHWTGMRSVVVSVRIIHFCKAENGIGNSYIELKAKTRDEVIEKWNKRPCTAH